jgi:hypothetical protein
MVNGEIFGLTAGHPFRAQFEREFRRDEFREIGQHVRSLEGEDSGDSSDEPFVFNDDDESSFRNESSTSAVSLGWGAGFPSTSIGGPVHGQHDILDKFLASAKWSQPYSIVIPSSAAKNASGFEESTRNHDWALLENLPHFISTLPNTISRIDPCHDIHVERTVPGPARGPVAISLAGIGAQMGFLHFSPVKMKVNESISDVQLITMERILRKFRLHCPHGLLYTDQPFSKLSGALGHGYFLRTSCVALSLQSDVTFHGRT